MHLKLVLEADSKEGRRFVRIYLRVGDVEMGGKVLSSRKQASQAITKKLR